MTLRSTFFALVTALCLVPTMAFAKTEIGVIDYAKVLNESKVGISIKEQLQVKEKEYTTQIKAKEEVLNGQKTELTNQRDVIGKEAFDKRYEEFKKEVYTTQKDVHEKRVLLEKNYKEAILKVKEKAVEIIKVVAEEQELAIVVTLSTVVHTNKSADITEEVLKRLNTELSSLTIDFSK